MSPYIVYVFWDCGRPQVYSRLRDARQQANGRPVYRATLKVEAFPVQANGRPVAPQSTEECDHITLLPFTSTAGFGTP